MFSMDIVATHHAVLLLGISIHPDLATVRSCCNGLTVALDRLRTLHVKAECVSVRPFRRVVRGSLRLVICTKHVAAATSEMPQPQKELAIYP